MSGDEEVLVATPEPTLRPDRTTVPRHWFDALKFANSNFPQTNHAINALVMLPIFEDLMSGKTTASDFFNSDLSDTHIRELSDATSALDKKYHIGHDVHPGFNPDRLQELWFVTKLSVELALMKLVKRIDNKDDFAANDFIAANKDGAEFQTALAFLRREDAALRSPDATRLSEEYKDFIADFWRNKKPDDRLRGSSGHREFVSQIDALMKKSFDPDDDLELQEAIFQAQAPEPIA